MYMLRSHPLSVDSKGIVHYDSNSWNWKAREHATGLIHGLKSSKNDAITWCERHIVVQWDYWTEMPTTAIITCIYCMTSKPGQRAA